MTTRMYRWLVPALALVLGLLIAAAELGRHASLLQAAIALAIVAAYAIALRLLQEQHHPAIPLDPQGEAP